MMGMIRMNQKGFSLIDLLIANVIIMVGIIAVFGPVEKAIRQRFDAEQTSVAMNLARSKMEELMNKKYHEMDPSVEEFGTIEGYPDFRRVVSVQDDEPMPHVKTVRIAVLWRVPGGNESTEEGVPYDPSAPDKYRALVELVILKESF